MAEFDNSELEDNKKYYCFICAQEFPGYEVCKNHIIETHEENTEYLLCPACKTPCRDIKSHWRVKHKSFALPKLPSYRVEKIYDWDEKHRKNSRKKLKWKEGFFDSIKMGKQIHYRSSWERDVMICFEKCVDVIEYYGDNHLCIEYYIHGVKKRYWPDFTVKMKNNETYIIEIKPENQTDWEINKAKWTYALAFCQKKQYNFQVWTQKYIRKVKTRAVRADVLLAEDVMPTPDDLEDLKEQKF
jgi:hypothetical protein